MQGWQHPAAQVHENENDMVVEMVTTQLPRCKPCTACGTHLLQDVLLDICCGITWGPISDCQHTKAEKVM
jgi:hypothetical protein